LAFAVAAFGYSMSKGGGRGVLSALYLYASSLVLSDDLLYTVLMLLYVTVLLLSGMVKGGED